MVMEENQSYSSVAGNTKMWPSLNALMKQGAQPTNYYANAHFSIPNYFMLTTGQTVTLDDSSTQIFNVDNIARRMLSSKVAFKVYAEGIEPGYLGGNTGPYVLDHNPFALLSDVAGNPQVANQVIQPFSQFLTDAAGNSLPAFSFIIPDLNDDAPQRYAAGRRQLAPIQRHQSAIRQSSLPGRRRWLADCCLRRIPHL